MNEKNKNLSNKEVKDKLKKIFEEEIGFKDMDDFVKQTLSDPIMSRIMEDGGLCTVNKELLQYAKKSSIDDVFKNFNVHDERVINSGNSLEKDEKKKIMPTIYPNIPI